MTITPSQKITPCLWFDTHAEEAARYYMTVFKNARIDSITHYGEGMPMPAGTVLTVKFSIEGQEFLGLNGGTYYTLTPAVSFIINCENQEELDDYWDKLGAGGVIDQCGWLRDKFGVSWQVVPTMIGRLMQSGNGAKIGAMMGAMMTMKKLDIATLQQAYDEG